MNEFLKGDFEFREAKPNEVQKMEWPKNFVPLSDPKAQKGVDYITSRGLSMSGDMYYDMNDEAIVFPYYFGSVFVGAQMRFIVPRKGKDGKDWKITTMPGTRLGIVIYNYNQERLMGHTKAVVVTEGAFNCLALEQSLNKLYGGTHKNPFKVIACSGSGSTKHHVETMQELKEKGITVIAAPDNDEAGHKMLAKLVASDAISQYSVPDSEKDWNDYLVELGDIGLARYFLSNIKKI